MSSICYYIGYRKLNETREEENCQKFEDAVIKDLMSAFHVFVVHNKGYIESRDLREVLGLTVTEIPSKELQQMLKEIGLVNDRKINFTGNALRKTVDSYPRVIYDLDCTKALGLAEGGGGRGKEIPCEKLGRWSSFPLGVSIKDSGLT